MVSSCVRRISLLVLALSVVIAVIGETRAGTCDSGERNAPVSTLYTENTCATITGQKIRVNPRIPALNKIERRYYMEAEVIMLREMEYGGRCFRSSEQNSLGLPYHIQLNTSLCDCTHTPGVDIFPGTNVARRYVRVEFECRGGFSGPDGSPLPFPSSFSLSLDVNSVNASIAIPHTAAAGPNVTTWDYYEYVIQARKTGGEMISSFSSGLLFVARTSSVFLLLFPSHAPPPLLSPHSICLSMTQ